MRNQALTRDLLAPAVELWNRCLGERFPMRPGLLEQNLFHEPNFDPEGSRAICDGDRLVALIAVKRQQVDIGVQQADNRGWISAILVDPAYQGQGIGSALLRDALAHLSRFAADDVSLGGDPGHLFPGVPFECRPALDWFARRGAYLSAPVCDLASEAIAAYRHPARAEEAFRATPGVTYRPAGEGDVAPLQAFMRAEFPGRWAYEVEQHLARQGRLEDVMLAVENGKVIGFARIHCPESTRFGPPTYWAPLFPGRHGGLGPIGVGADQRGRGVGLALLSASIAELRDRGIQSGVIDWTMLVRLYGLVGFRPWRWYTVASLPAAPAP
ncbi:MAG: GNAT family N-acetyltransferase [Bacillota bacterium]